MIDPTDERSLATVIYFLVSLVITLIGLILLLFHPGAKSQSSTSAAVGESLIAGGIASVGFGLLRYIDDATERKRRSQMQGMGAELEERFARLRADIESFAINSARSVRVTSSASIRCVSDIEIGTRFQAEYTRFMLDDRRIDVDVLGLKLFRFLDDQLNWLISRHHETRVRLLLQNPFSPVFDEICSLEARGIRATQEDIARTIDTLDGSVVDGRSLTWRREQLYIELRFFDRYQPVTLFRVKDTIYVRPRVSTPQGAASRFYEVYESRDSMPHYNVQLRHFEECWRASEYSETAVARLRTDLRT